MVLNLLYLCNSAYFIEFKYIIKSLTLSESIDHLKMKIP